MLWKKKTTYLFSCIVMQIALCQAGTAPHITNFTISSSDPLYAKLKSTSSHETNSLPKQTEVSQNSGPEVPQAIGEKEEEETRTKRLSNNSYEDVGLLIFYPLANSQSFGGSGENELLVDKIPAIQSSLRTSANPYTMHYYLVRKPMTHQEQNKKSSLDFHPIEKAAALQKILTEEPVDRKSDQKNLVVPLSQKDFSMERRKRSSRSKRSWASVFSSLLEHGLADHKIPESGDVDDETTKRQDQEKVVSDTSTELTALSDPVPSTGTTEVATSRQFGGFFNAITFGFFPRLLTALSNPAIIVMLLILNAWFAYTSLTGIIFNPGIIINPGGGSSSSSSSSSSPSSSSSSSGGIIPAFIPIIPASVAGDSGTSDLAPTLTDSEVTDDGTLGILGASTQTDASGSDGTGPSTDGSTSGGTSPGSDPGSTAPDDSLIPPGGPIQPAFPVFASFRPSSTTENEVSQVTGASTQEGTSDDILLLNGTVWDILANISSASFDTQSPGSGGASSLSILPLPEPRPTTMEGAVPISWLGPTDSYDGMGSSTGTTSETPEPTVAPSYPVLHACLVLGGDVPSCVAQAELYGQLLYEHTVNALQKPITDESTEQTQSTSDITKITESSLPSDQSKKPPTKHESVLANFPHASFVHPIGSTPIKEEVVQSGALPSSPDAHKPLIQQILSQIQIAQASTPYVELVQSSVKNGTFSNGVSVIDGTNQETNLQYTESSIGLFINHLPGKDPNKEDHLISPVSDTDQSTTPHSVQTHSPIQASQEKPPKVEIVVQAHPHAQIVTAAPTPTKDGVQIIDNIHPHGQVIDNPPPNADIIQSLYPPEHLVDVLLHHFDRPPSGSSPGASNNNNNNNNNNNINNNSKTLYSGKFTKIKPIIRGSQYISRVITVKDSE